MSEREKIQALAADMNRRADNSWTEHVAAREDGNDTKAKMARIAHDIYAHCRGSIVRLLDEPAASEEPVADEKALNEMVADPRFWRERDPEIVAKVSAGFKKLYSTSQSFGNSEELPPKGDAWETGTLREAVDHLRAEAKRMGITFPAPEELREQPARSEAEIKAEALEELADIAETGWDKALSRRMGGGFFAWEAGMLRARAAALRAKEAGDG